MDLQRPAGRAPRDNTRAQAEAQTHRPAQAPEHSRLSKLRATRPRLWRSVERSLPPLESKDEVLASPIRHRHELTNNGVKASTSGIHFPVLAPSERPRCPPVGRRPLSPPMPSMRARFLSLRCLERPSGPILSTQRSKIVPRAHGSMRGEPPHHRAEIQFLPVGRR
jgi:hypothetical protein